MNILFACVVVALLGICILHPSQSTELHADPSDPLFNANIETEHAAYMQSRRRLQHALRGQPIDHGKDWMALAEVNGLKNTEVAVFVTSTTNGNDHFLWDRIIPSARTWMRLFAHVYTIVEDNFLIRYALRHCLHAEYPSYTVFSCHNEPHYILTRNCTNEYYNAKGICCKIDDAINFLVNENHELFEQTKYMIEGDDDTFFRPDQILRWLAAVDNSGVSAEFPLVANSDTSARPEKENHYSYIDNGGVWHINGCGDIHTNGWYQPLMLNKKALERLRVASREYGFTKTCVSFEVSQDVGFGPYAWIMELKHIFMPGVEINHPHAGTRIFKPDQMAVHDVKHHPDDLCDQPEKWPHSFRYNQRIAVGCGDLNVRGPFHNATLHEADMYDAWEYFRVNGVDLKLGYIGMNDFYNASVTMYSTPGLDGKPRVKNIIYKNTPLEDKDGEGRAYPNKKFYKGDPVEYRTIPYVYSMPGFRDTSFSQKHDLTQSWETFYPKDCKDPGKIVHNRKARV